MKIALFQNLSPGGAKRVVFEEIKILSKEHEVDLYQISSQEKDFLDWGVLDCNIFTYEFNLTNNLPSFLNRFYSDFKTFILLSKLHKKIAIDIEKKGYDIVIVHPDKFTQAPFLLKYLNIKCIYYCEELLRIAYETQFGIPVNLHYIKKQYEAITRKLRKKIDYENARLSDSILTNSFFTKKNIIMAYKKNADVCYLGVDTNFFKPLNLKKDCFLFIGEKTDSTGYTLIQKIFELYNIKKKFKIKIINYSLSEKILPDADLRKEYSSAIATLCLGRMEPFGLTALESMSCGTPVIAINEGGYRESVIEGKTGYLINRNPKVLYEKMKYIMNNPDIAEAMGKNARKIIEDNWSWEKHVSCLESYFNL